MWLPTSLYNAAKHSSRIVFCCAYGHEQVFAEGEGEEAKLRRERDMLKQQMAQRDDVISQQSKELERERAAVRALKDGSVRARKRSIAGTCPCCKRTFRQMALHMAKQHPEFKAEAA
jgi:hypothetical protein